MFNNMKLICFCIVSQDVMKNGFSSIELEDIHKDWIRRKSQNINCNYTIIPGKEWANTSIKVTK